jgi:two-component system, cell cycle response regulator DivK
MNRPILIIEDNAQNFYLMRYLLEQNGYSVVAAQDGRQGIELACSSTPLAILLDIQLPQMDGYAVARELRKCHNLDAVPIIAVTSYAMMGDREKALDAGATDYVEKPIDPDTFVDRLRRHIPG